MKKSLIPRVGNVKGRMTNPDHRSAKLIARWDELRRKFENTVVRGKGSLQGRLAYGCLLVMETGVRVGNEGSAEGFVPTLTEFVKVKDKMTPVKHRVDGKYVDHPDRVGIEVRWVRQEGEWVRSEKAERRPVKTYGLTTLLGRHVKVSITGRKEKLRLKFVGKKSVDQDLTTTNYVLVGNCPKKDRGENWLGIKDHELRRFVRRYVGKGFTPKDLRRARVNLTFCEDVWPGCEEEWEKAESKSAVKKVVSSAIKETAGIIGHTPGVCKASYLSKELISSLVTRS